jgi:hypothetical protein
MTETATAEKVATLDELQAALESLGYQCSRADLDNDGTPEPLLTTSIGVDDKQYPVVISMEEGNFLVDCEFCNLGDLHADNAEKLSAQCLRLLTLNHEVAPFAFAIVDDTLDGIDDGDPIVLVNRLPIGDLSVEEVDQAFAALRRALNIALVSV